MTLKLLAGALSQPGQKGEPWKMPGTWRTQGTWEPKTKLGRTLKVAAQWRKEAGQALRGGSSYSGGGVQRQRKQSWPGHLGGSGNSSKGSASLGPGQSQNLEKEKKVKRAPLGRWPLHPFLLSLPSLLLSPSLSTLLPSSPSHLPSPPISSLPVPSERS